MADAMFDVSNHMPSKPEKLGFWDVMKLSWAVAKIQDRWIIKRYQRRLLMGGDPEGGESGLGLGLGLGLEEEEAAVMNGLENLNMDVNVGFDKSPRAFSTKPARQMGDGAFPDMEAFYNLNETNKTCVVI